MTQPENGIHGRDRSEALSRRILGRPRAVTLRVYALDQADDVTAADLLDHFNIDPESEHANVVENIVRAVTTPYDDYKGEVEAEKAVRRDASEDPESHEDGHDEPQAAADEAVDDDAEDQNAGDDQDEPEQTGLGAFGCKPTASIEERAATDGGEQP